MKKHLMLTGALFAFASSGTAFAQTACESYTVQRGDTLGTIAKAAYGSTEKFRMIYEANQSAIANPDIISVGEVLSIPCDSTASGGGAMVKVAQPSSSASSSGTATNMASNKRAAYREEIRLVTMPSGDAPFSGVDLPKGGMITEIAMRAIEIADPDQEVNVYFIGDVRAHLSTLLPLHAFDIGFTWYRPECDKDISNLNASDRSRCTNFLASDPVYQDTVGVFARKDSPYLNATTYEDLHGASLCRPEGYFEFDLVQAGLVDPNVKIVKLSDSQECLRAVNDGEVDLWSINVVSAPDEIKKAGLENEIVAVPAVEFVLNSHYLIAADHPRGQELVDMLNTGLRQMVESGEWYDLIQWHLTEYEKSQNE